MCKCTPNIRTPFCGKSGCEWPGSKPEGARDPVPSKDQLTDQALLAHANAYDQGPGGTFEFDTPTLLAMLRGLAATVEGMIRDGATLEPAHEPHVITQIEHALQDNPGGISCEMADYIRGCIADYRHAQPPRDGQ